MYRIRAFFQTVAMWFKTHFLTKTQKDEDTFVYKGSKIIHPGHSVFEYDKKLKTLDYAEYRVENGKKVIRIKKESMYVVGLNRNSAYKKLVKNGYEVKGRLRPLDSEINKAKVLKTV